MNLLPPAPVMRIFGVVAAIVLAVIATEAMLGVWKRRPK